jgi:hypothetical protein
MSEGLQTQRNGNSRDEFMIVSRMEDGFRVYSAREPQRQYLVSGEPDNPACTCDAFAEDATCEHVRAVLDQGGEDEHAANEERRAIQVEGRPSSKRRRKPAANNSPTMMTLKRSVSPDGRIDSLSVEVSCPIGQESVSDIKSRAKSMLQVQGEITRDFLNSDRKPDFGGRQNGHHANGNGNSANGNSESTPIPAKMLSIGTTNGKWGPRLFISFQANGNALRLYGTAKQLADAVGGAGFRYLEEDVVDGVFLNLPCRVITKRTPDNRYLNIERVLPAQGPAAHAGGR